MAARSVKDKAVEKTIKAKKPPAALMVKGSEALVPSRAPGKLATVKKSAGVVKKKPITST
jgi:hypothetical protein